MVAVVSIGTTKKWGIFMVIQVAVEGSTDKDYWAVDWQVQLLSKLFGKGKGKPPRGQRSTLPRAQVVDDGRP